LILQTTKRVYRAGEPIHVTAYLENESEEQTFYVGRDLDGFCAIIPLHYIELRIINQNNKRIASQTAPVLEDGGRALPNVRRFNKNISLSDQKGFTDRAIRVT